MTVLVDTTNLFHCVQKGFGDEARLCYVKYLQFLEKMFKKQENIVAYVAQYRNSVGFITSLEHKGYSVVTQEPHEHTVEGTTYMRTDFMVQMTLDAIQNLDADKPMIIGSADLRVLPLLEHLKDRVGLLYVHAAGIPKEFERFAQCREISEKELQK